MNAIILSALSGVLMMFTGILTQNKIRIRNTAIAAAVVLLIGNLLNVYTGISFQIETHNMLRFDQFGLFFNTIVIVLILLYFFLSGSEISKVGNYPAEYFALLFFSLCGVTILSSFSSLLMLFLGIEIMTIPLYILTGADKKNLKSNEASLKYLLMGAFSTGLLLMGIALLYGANGNFNVDASATNTNPTGIMNLGIIAPVGLLLIFISMAFKVSAAPFHFWTPDVYDGAPGVFTSYMATIVKAAGFIAFIKVFSTRLNEFGPSAKLILPVIIIATLLVGNITAVFQQSVKRMLAYSSIAQAGFMLFAIYANNDISTEGILIYTVAYSTATIGIFATLIKMKDYTFEGYNGLSKTQPLIAATNTVFLLSLAGIPLTAGFFGKYYMLLSVLKSNGMNVLWLVIVAVIFAAVSVYYYFRVIQAMYFKDGEAEITEITPAFKTGLIILAVVIILIGINPSFLLNWFYF